MTQCALALKPINKSQLTIMDTIAQEQFSHLRMRWSETASLTNSIAALDVHQIHAAGSSFVPNALEKELASEASPPGKPGGQFIAHLKACVRSVALAWVTVGLLVATGCRGISTAHTQDIGGPRFPASDPAKIEILRDVPARPHVELGQVWAHSSDRNADASELEDALRKEAAKLGADAFVVWRDEIQQAMAQTPSLEPRALSKQPMDEAFLAPR